MIDGYKIENKALREWARDGANGRGSGKISKLAFHIGVTQPALSKMIDGSIRIKFDYIEDIMEFTGIPARELLPEYYDLFKKSLRMEIEEIFNQRKREITSVFMEMQKDIEKLHLDV